jgi:hypothetical protein
LSLAILSQCWILLVISFAWSVSKLDDDFPAVSMIGLYAQALSRVQTIPSVSIVFFISLYPLFKELVDDTSNDEV